MGADYRRNQPKPYTGREEKSKGSWKTSGHADVDTGRYHSGRPFGREEKSKDIAKASGHVSSDTGRYKSLNQHDREYESKGNMDNKYHSGAGRNNIYQEKDIQD